MCMCGRWPILLNKSLKLKLKLQRCRNCLFQVNLLLQLNSGIFNVSTFSRFSINKWSKGTAYKTAGMICINILCLGIIKPNQQNETSIWDCCIIGNQCIFLSISKTNQNKTKHQLNFLYLLLLWSFTLIPYVTMIL